MKSACMKVTCNAQTMEIALKSKLFGLTTKDSDKVIPEPEKDASNVDGFDFRKTCKLGECDMTYKIEDEK